MDAPTPGSGRVITNVSAGKFIERIVFSPWIELDEFGAMQQKIQSLCPDADISRSPLIRNPDDEKTIRAMNRLCRSLAISRAASFFAGFTAVYRRDCLKRKCNQP